MANASGCMVLEKSEVIRGLSKVKLTEGAMINIIEDLGKGFNFISVT